MKIYTSYFYQIRFFPSNYVPISTAMWDPKWYHNNRGNKYVYKDKRGVYNGIRNEALHPGPTCHDLCGGRENCGRSANPASCAFLRAYRKQLDAINFPQFLSELQAMLERTGIDNPIPVLIVHEAPDNPCSERSVLLQWLRDNGVPAEELTYPIPLA